MKNRQTWLDAAKGIGIILVVICHIKVTIFTPYIYWFHMPLFFMISGYLHKQPNYLKEIKTIIVKKTYRFLIPYFSYYFVILIIMKINFNMPLNLVWNDLKAILIGGEYLTGCFGVFWFITVLYFTEIVFFFIMYIPSITIRVLTVLMLYSISHFSIIKIPCYWAVDITLYAILFYYIGFIIKKINVELNWNHILVCSLGMNLVLVLLQVYEIIDYQLVMKNKTYNHFILDILIPVSFCITILGVCWKCKNNTGLKYLSLIGKYSLPIMYLHIPVYYIFSERLSFRNASILFIFLAIIIPIIISKCFFEKVHILRFLFLGKTDAIKRVSELRC